MFQNPFTHFNRTRLKLVLLFFFISGLFQVSFAQQQLQWTDVSHQYQPLPQSVRVYKTVSTIDGKPNIAYYVKAKLDDKKLLFTTDTTHNRRLTPQQFYAKNGQPLVVVNTTFFSFATHQNLNAVVKDGKLVSHNVSTIKGRGKDTLTYLHPFTSAIGITKKRKADVAWLYTDSSKKTPYALQLPINAFRDSVEQHSLKDMAEKTTLNVVSSKGKDKPLNRLKKWKVQTAVGGGPALVQNGEIKITNEEERKFYGKAINDKHPRTAMGYTADGHIIILVVQGRFPGIAEGVNLTQEAQMLKAIGCVEALNLDGGGSSCLQVNGKETIAPSDKVQRAVPAVFIIAHK